MNATLSAEWLGDENVDAAYDGEALRLASIGSGCRQPYERSQGVREWKQW